MYLEQNLKNLENEFGTLYQKTGFKSLVDYISLEMVVFQDPESWLDQLEGTVFIWTRMTS